MSRKTIFVCDGCDVEETTAVNLPQGWARIEINLDVVAGPVGRVGGDFEETVDLCSTCRRRLGNNVNPKSWPRGTAEKPGKP